MSGAQLAKRAKLKASQSIEDIQQSEIAGTVKLQTLRQLAAAMDCQLVYAIVPAKPLREMREERAREVANRKLKRVSHSMKLEDQTLRAEEEQRALELEVEALMEGDPKRLWD